MGAQAIESNKFHIHETIGCLMFLSAGVQALLGHKSMAEMVSTHSMPRYESGNVLTNPILSCLSRWGRSRTGRAVRHSWA